MQQFFSKPYKILAIFLIIAVLLPGCILPKEVHALTVEKMVTKYHLDIGVEQVWGTEDKYGNIIWDDGIRPGGTMTTSKSIPFPKEVYNVKAYPYDAEKFNWEDTEHYTSNVGSEKYFDDNYKRYSSTNITVTNPSSSGNVVSFSYSAKMSSIQQYNLTDKLNRGQIDQVFSLMAGPYSTNPEGDVKKGFSDLYSKLNAGRNGVDPRVQAYMYFTPVIIQYDVKEMVEIGSIDADLNLPATAKTGEEYTVSDNSYVEEVLSLNDAVLEKKIGDGAWQTVTTWKGTGEKGKNTGGSITEKSDEVCTITYRITINASDGQTDTAEKTIYITDGREISGKADLILDKYTYEGHPADALDESTFEVDGVAYSAKRAYEEDVASNAFTAKGGWADKETDTTALVTFPKRGTYPVDLDILTATDEHLSDTEYIEVRKTPYVIDNLGGFQKQNRKQILTFNIATYPDKPIVDYDITIKDLKSNEVVRLTKDAPQENGGCIKTRTVKSQIKDKYWTTLTVEFLTKYPRYSLTGEDSQRFSYKITVTDSKGDTDDAYKEFDVVPDKPPFANITMQDTFLRAEGTNTAEIVAEDSSSSDGDQLQRTWSVIIHSPLDNTEIGSYIKAENVEGFKKLAFGTDQKIGFNKEGVGKSTVKLHVKDVWKEPTLEEYITASDYLEGETTKTTDVINIAPVVSLETIFFNPASIFILTNQSSKSAIEEKVNGLKADFLEQQIDADINVISTVDVNNEGFKKLGEEAWDFGCNLCDSVNGLCDTNYVFKITPEQIILDGKYPQCVGMHTLYALTPSKNPAQTTFDRSWSYPLEGAVSVGLDDKEKYVYIVTSNGTQILNHHNGAYLTTVPGAWKGGFISPDGKRLYKAGNNCIERLDFETAQQRKACNFIGSCLKEMNGKLCFITHEEGMKFNLCEFDMMNESIKFTQLPELPSNMLAQARCSITPIDIDSEGKVLFKQELLAPDGDYSRNTGYSFYLIDSRKNTASTVSYTHSNDRGAGEAALVKDASGRAHYVFWTCSNSSDRDPYRYNNNVKVFELTGDNTIATGHAISVGTGSTGIGYLKYDTNDHKIYYAAPFWWDLTGIHGSGAKAIDTNTWAVNDTNKFGSGWVNAVGIGKTLPNRSVIFRTMTGWSGGRTEVSVYNESISADEAASYAVNTFADFTHNERNYMINTLGDLGELANTKELLSTVNAEILDFRESLKKNITEIKAKLKEPPIYLEIKGDGSDNKAILERSVDLKEGATYEYSYDLYTSGTAVDLFNINTNWDKQIPENGLVENIKADEDFNSGYITPYLHTASGNPFYEQKGLLGREYETGRSGHKSYHSGYATFSFTLSKSGYVEFDLLKIMGGNHVCSLTIDGRTVEASQGSKTIEHAAYPKNYTNSINSQLQNKRVIFLDKGTHTVSISGDSDFSGGFTYIKVAELGTKETINTFKPCTITSKDGGKRTITNKFEIPNRVLTQKNTYTCDLEPALWNEGIKGTTFGYKSVKSTYAYTKQVKRPFVSYGKTYWETVDVAVNRIDCEANELKLNDYASLVIPYYCYYSDYPSYNIQTLSSTTFSSDTVTAKGYYYKFKNPYQDKILVVKTSLGLTPSKLPTTGSGYAILDAHTLLLNPLSETSVYINSTFSNDLKISTAPHNEGMDLSKYAYIKNKELSMGISLNKNHEPFIEVTEITDSKVVLNHFKAIDNMDDLKATISFSADKLNGKEAYISNFKLYEIKNGKRTLVASNNMKSTENLLNCAWKMNTTGQGEISAKQLEYAEEEKEEPALVYKKGELVRYNINYSDYEQDPSKKSQGYSYWLYAHTPYNDGQHPDAAIIYDEDGNIKSVCGEAVTPGAVTIDNALNIAKSKGLKVLNEPIDRFYVDGKYTVYHWEFDDTSRGAGNIRADGAKEGFPLYDKSSNTAELTFYVEGSATAPWIIGISTSPATVTENNYFSINVGIDDMEKDVLNLTTEVYKDKKHIFTHRKKNICPIDANGNSTTNPAIAVGYPVTNTGALPDKAQAGTYEVVCTVRDQTGAGIGTYKFIVVSDGKIIGNVYHTEQWEVNRKKYNLANFGNECNRILQFNDYVRLSMPRVRGTNVFWSGEKFMLNADVAGTPTKVTCSINGTIYATTMKSSGKKNATGETIYTGSLWDKSMINKWGRKAPIELVFTFTAVYSGGTTKKHEVRVIVDNMDDYWKLHRVF